MAKAEAVREAYKRTQFPDMLNGKILQKNKQDEWVPPPPEWLKNNVDAGTNAKRQCSRLRAIKTATFKDDVLYVEAETAEWGICITKEVDMQSVILETNSQALANLINNNGGNRTEIH